MYKFGIPFILAAILSLTIIASCKKDSSCEKTTWYRDADGDTFGDPNNSKLACVQPEGYVANNLDCDDNDPNINPLAPEICDGIDNDCDGLIDDEDPDFDPSELATWYRDADGDGYGDPSPSFIIVSCSQPDGYVSNALDCNDSNPLVQGPSTFYKDADGDGFGDPDEFVITCTMPTGYVTNNLDCDDSDASVNPSAPEIPGDGIDNNCNGAIDENCVSDCSGKACGDDGCGGSCGGCPPPLTCGPTGLCE